MSIEINDQAIAFIICTNQPAYLEECKRYIHHLIIPDGYMIDIIPITGAVSMTAGYNQGMRSSHAKYKVYLHQDVFILNRNFLADTLQILTADSRIGMIGMVGTKRLPDNACMWTTPMRTGALRSCVLNTVDDYFDLPVSQTKGYAPVQAVDGLLIMTQYDIPWREDLDLGWDFYDVSQSMEFTRQGYRIVVPYQSVPWVLHDNGFLHLSGYHIARKHFLSEYFPERTTEITACDQADRQAAARSQPLGQATDLLQQILAMLTQAQNLSEPETADTQAPSLSIPEPADTLTPDLSIPETADTLTPSLSVPETASSPVNDLYARITSLLRSHLEEYQENEEYCILCLLANIDETERAAGVRDPLLTRLTPDLSEIAVFYRQIKFHIWQLKYPFSADIQYTARKYLQEHLSEIAIQYFQKIYE